jgi:hypothetical protein
VIEWFGLKRALPEQSAQKVTLEPRRRALLQHLIFESNAFRIVCLEPPLRGFWIGEGLDVVGMANVISGVDINPDRFHLNASYGRVLLAVFPFLPLAFVKALHDRRAPRY